MPGYNFSAMWVAVMLFALATACIVLRRPVARASNAFYKGLGMNRLVLKESTHIHCMTIAGIAATLLGVVILILGFFV